MRCIVRNITGMISKKPQFVLEDISFSISEGEILAVVGESGSGKSSLLNILAGFLPIQHGVVILDDKTVSCATFSLPPVQRNVGYIFQEQNLLPHLTLYENLVLGMSAEEINQKKADLDKLIHNLHVTHLQDRYPEEVSGGQQQRIALGRALIHDKKLLLFDEPFSGLDTPRMNALALEIKQMVKKYKRAAVIVTHHIEEAYLVADKLAIIKEGRLLQTDTLQNVFEQPKDTYIANFLGCTNLIKGAVINAETVETEFGNVKLFHNIKLPKKNSVTVLTRQDDFQVVQGNDWVVTNARYVGMHKIITARKGTTHIQILTDHDYGASVGDKIGIELKHTHQYSVYDKKGQIITG